MIDYGVLKVEMHRLTSVMVRQCRVEDAMPCGLQKAFDSCRSIFQRILPHPPAQSDEDHADATSPPKGITEM